MDPFKGYNTIEVAYPFRLRGPGNQQNNDSLLWPPPTYLTTGRGDRPPVPTTTYSQGIALGYFSLHNRSGGTLAAAGIGVRIPNYLWIAGQWDDDGATPFTADTTDAQGVGATDFELETTTANDGYVVASRVPFNAISIDVGTASGTNSPTRALRYTNPAGDGWIDFANLFVQTGAAAALSVTGTTIANEALVVWDVPLNWGVTAAAGLSGIARDYYAVNMRATTAPDVTAAVADSLSIYRIFMLTEIIGDNGTLSQDFAGKDFRFPVEGDALVALFDTANNQNRVIAQVKTY